MDLCCSYEDQVNDIGTYIRGSYVYTCIVHCTYSCLVISLGVNPFTVLLGHVVKSWKSTNTLNLWFGCHNHCQSQFWNQSTQTDCWQPDNQTWLWRSYQGLKKSKHSFPLLDLFSKLCFSLKYYISIPFLPHSRIGRIMSQILWFENTFKQTWWKLGLNFPKTMYFVFCLNFFACWIIPTLSHSFPL